MVSNALQMLTIPMFRTGNFNPVASSRLCLNLHIHVVCGFGWSQSLRGAIMFGLSMKMGSVQRTVTQGKIYMS